MILVTIAALLAVLILRTISLRRPELSVTPCNSADDDFIRLDDSVIHRFQSGLRLETVSTSVGNYNRQELDRLVQFIIRSYPALHSSDWVKWQIVANYSLLYHIKGSNPSLRPYLLMSHLDVVPADANEWTYPPFGAEIHDGFINARGALDQKEGVFGILESVDYLVKNGKRPKRSFYVAFGHDEEVMGYDGAMAMATKLQDSGVKLEYILDEGFMVMTDVLSFVKKPIAFIGVSEKGFASLRLSTNVTGGHASLPGPESSIGIVAKAVSRLEANPHPSMLGTGPEVGLLEHLASEAPFLLEVILTNQWLFGPLLSRVMSYDRYTNAVIRTTTAVTMFNAGIKDNVIAPYAEAIVNHRIHSKQSVSEVIEYDRSVINDDRVKIEVVSACEPLPLSDYGTESFGYQMIRSTIKQIFGQNEVVIAPSVMIANTDTKHYMNLTKSIYRFTPIVVAKDDVNRIHGINERLSIDNFQRLINFYYHLIVNSDRESLDLSDHSSSSHQDF